MFKTKDLIINIWILIWSFIFYLILNNILSIILCVSLLIYNIYMLFIRENKELFITINNNGIESHMIDDNKYNYETINKKEINKLMNNKKG